MGTRPAVACRRRACGGGLSLTPGRGLDPWLPAWLGGGPRRGPAWPLSSGQGRVRRAAAGGWPGPGRLPSHVLPVDSAVPPPRAVSLLTQPGTRVLLSLSSARREQGSARPLPSCTPSAWERAGVQWVLGKCMSANPPGSKVCSPSGDAFLGDGGSAVCVGNCRGSASRPSVCRGFFGRSGRHSGPSGLGHGPSAAPPGSRPRPRPAEESPAADASRGPSGLRPNSSISPPQRKNSGV